MGMGSGLPSSSGIQSENSALSAYLRDSRMQPSELYIPDSLGDTLATRTTTQYGHLYNGHKASVVKMELFIPYFNTDRYVIDPPQWWCVPLGQGKQQHQTIGPPGRHYPPIKWIQWRCSPKTTGNAHWLTLQNRSQSRKLIKVITDSFWGLLPGPTHETHATGHHMIPIGSMQKTWHLKQHYIKISIESIQHWMAHQMEKSLNLYHLAEITDIWSKLIQNLAKVGKNLSPSPHPAPKPISKGTGENFLANCERDFDSHLHHILHLDELLARDAKHHIQLGYHVINYPRYIPTTVELVQIIFLQHYWQAKGWFSLLQGWFLKQGNVQGHTQAYE